MGRDKALLEVGGRALACRVADALRVGGAASVCCVGGDLVALRTLGLDGVPDPRQGSGPLGGLVTALEAVDSDVVLVVACDLADLDGQTVARVVAGLGGHDVAAARTDRLEPLCAAWRRPRALASLRADHDRGVRAVHEAMRALDVVEVAVAPASLRNVNRPDDLAG
jgi:molybdopterin-guanine dinucleotide biosynthesis protein A